MQWVPTKALGPRGRWWEEEQPGRGEVVVDARGRLSGRSSSGSLAHAGIEAGTAHRRRRSLPRLRRAREGLAAGCRDADRLS
jgi:hypothetical protein